MHRTAAAALLTLSVLATAGCVGPLRGLTLGQNCNTAVSPWHGVDVDLTTVLPFEGGTYDVTASVPAHDAAATAQMSGNSMDPLVVYVDVELDRDPVTVDVEVTSDGRVIYKGSDTVTPVASSPKARACNGTSYWAGVQAQPDGQLKPLVWGEPARDVQGRLSVVVDTRCGVRDFFLQDGTTFVRVDGLLGDGAGGPPAGWAWPAQRGWVDIAEGVAVFEDERGHREVFRRWLSSDGEIPCQA